MASTISSANAVVTTALITQINTQPDFVQYVINPPTATVSGPPFTEFCSPGSTFTTSSSYGDCVETAAPSRPLYTNCVGANILVFNNDGGYSVCPTNAICATNTRCDVYPSPSACIRRILCVRLIGGYTGYAALITSTTYTTTSTFLSTVNIPEQTTSTLAATTSLAATKTSAPALSSAVVPQTTTSNTTTPPSISAADTSNRAGTNSKPWIAAAVVVPVVVIALIGILVWWVMYNKYKRKVATRGTRKEEAPSIPIYGENPRAEDAVSEATWT